MFPSSRHVRPSLRRSTSSDGSSFTLNNSKADSWTSLKNQLSNYDAQFISGLREELDSNLLFAGLFSAVTTAFLMESYRFLIPNENQEVIDVLKAILFQVSSNQNNTNSQQPSALPANEPVLVRSQIFNILWFFALATSLFVALFSILMKQWLREYLRWTEAHGQDAIRIRQIRREALSDWSVKDKIIVLLPSMLQLSLILFLIGLIFFLLLIDTTTAYAVTVLVVVYSCVFGYTLVAPAFKELSPYRTQLSVYLRNIAHACRTSWSVVVTVSARRKSLGQALRDASFMKRFDWVYRDQLRTWELAKEPNYDPLNTAFAWIRSQFPDESTYTSILDALSQFNSLPFVIDAGRRLFYKPHALDSILTYWTRPAAPGQGFDPDLIIHGLEAIYLTPRAPGELPSLVPPVEILPGLTEFIIYRFDYMLSNEQVAGFTRLFYELHSYQYDHLGLGSALPKENDLAYRRILRYLLEPRPAWIKPPAEALHKIILYGCALHRNLSLDGAVPFAAPRSFSTAALVFQIALLSVDEHLDDIPICGSFRRLCISASQLFSLSNGLPLDWADNVRPTFVNRVSQFREKYPPFADVLQPVYDHLRRSATFRDEMADCRSGSRSPSTSTWEEASMSASGIVDEKLEGLEVPDSPLASIDTIMPMG